MKIMILHTYVGTAQIYTIVINTVCLQSLDSFSVYSNIFKGNTIFNTLNDRVF